MVKVSPIARTLRDLAVRGPFIVRSLKELGFRNLYCKIAKRISDSLCYGVPLSRRLLTFHDFDIVSMLAVVFLLAVDEIILMCNAKLMWVWKLSVTVQCKK